MNGEHPPGRLITLEGGEGAGKSTQAKLLLQRLTHELGIDVVQTREPGGTPGAEAIREVLVNGPVDRWTATSEALLMIAARVDHYTRLIAPALAAGHWVVCDRFMDSTMAYQGLAGGLGADVIDTLHRAVLPGVVPDLTLVLDLDPALGLQRALARTGDRPVGGAGERVDDMAGDMPGVMTGPDASRNTGTEDRFEAKGIEHHRAIGAGFHTIATTHPDRVKVINAAQTREGVGEDIWRQVYAHFGLGPQISAPLPPRTAPARTTPLQSTDTEN